MSKITLSIEIFPIVFLKNSSSMVCDETERNAGNNKSNLPNRNGCDGYALASYLLNVNWVWSWKAIILCKSLGWPDAPFGLFKIELSSEDEEELDEELEDEKFSSIFSVRVVLNRVITFRHANSVESTWACLNLFIISWKCRISVMILISFSDEVVSEFRPAWASRGVISNGIWNWAADKMKISRQPSSSNDNLNKRNFV